MVTFSVGGFVHPEFGPIPAGTWFQLPDAWAWQCQLTLRSWEFHPKTGAWRLCPRSLKDEDRYQISFTRVSSKRRAQDQEHEMVCEMARGSRPGTPQQVECHHMDGNPENNYWGNLEWKPRPEHTKGHPRRSPRPVVCTYPMVCPLSLPVGLRPGETVHYTSAGALARVLRVNSRPVAHAIARGGPGAHKRTLLSYCTVIYADSVLAEQIAA